MTPNKPIFVADISIFREHPVSLIGPGWLEPYQLFQNEKPALPAKTRGTFILKTDNGSMVNATLFFMDYWPWMKIENGQGKPTSKIYFSCRPSIPGFSQNPISFNPDEEIPLQKGLNLQLHPKEPDSYIAIDDSGKKVIAKHKTISARGTKTEVLIINGKYYTGRGGNATLSSCAVTFLIGFLGIVFSLLSLASDGPVDFGDPLALVILVNLVLLTIQSWFIFTLNLGLLHRMAVVLLLSIIEVAIASFVLSLIS